MQERKDSDWEGVSEGTKMSPRQIDVKPVIAAFAVFTAGGLLGATAAIEFAKGINEYYAQLLQPPVTYALQFSAGGMAALIGIGIGFSVERYIEEGEI